MDHYGVNLCWAVPVDAAILAARIDSYVTTKAALMAFNLCMEKTPTSKHLPTEVLLIIAQLVRNSAFENEYDEFWGLGQRCATKTCVYLEHMTPKEIQSYKQEYLSDDSSTPKQDFAVDDPDFIRYVEEVAEEDGGEFQNHHKHRVRQYINALRDIFHPFHKQRKGMAPGELTLRSLLTPENDYYARVWH